MTPPACAVTIAVGLTGSSFFFLSFLSAFLAAGFGSGRAQSFQVPSAPEVTSRLPSGCRATPVTAVVWTASSPRTVALAVFQMRTLPWLLPATSKAALRLNPAAVTVPVSPSKVRISFPFAAPSRRSLPSLDPVASCLPSAERAMTATGPGWAGKATVGLGFWVQVRTRPSAPAVMILVPSGNTAMALIDPAWAPSVRGCWFPAVHSSLPIVSPRTSSLPSAPTATLATASGAAFSVRPGLLLAVVQVLSVLSALPVTRVLPSPARAIDVSDMAWPASGTGGPVSVHVRTLPSAPAVASR